MKLFNSHSEHKRRRSGFSLIEILVAISIVALLATISLFAIAPAMTAARENSTRATLMQLSRIIEAKIDEITDGNAAQGAKITGYAGKLKQWNDSITDAQTRAVAMSIQYRANFPEPVDLSIADQRETLLEYLQLRSSAGLSPLKIKGIELTPDNTSLDKFYSPAINPAWLWHAMLYSALSQTTFSGSGATFNIDGIPSKHIKSLPTTDDVPESLRGAPYFADDWGNPIEFYRWPSSLFTTDNPAVTAALLKDFNPTQKFTDPFDPVRVFERNLTVSIRYVDGQGAPNTLSFNPTPAPGNIGKISSPTRYWAFMLISPGPDGELGISRAPSISLPVRYRSDVSITSASNVMDNITNRQK